MLLTMNICQNCSPLHLNDIDNALESEHFNEMLQVSL